MVPTETQVSHKPRQFVIFYVNRQACAIDIRGIHEIICFQKVTPIPGSAKFHLGITELRGQIIPVVCLGTRMKIDAVGQDKSISRSPNPSHILIARMANKKIGLAVDDVQEVVRIDSGEVQQPGQLFQVGEIPYLEGVLRLNGQLVLVIDLDRLLAPEDLTRMAQF